MRLLFTMLLLGLTLIVHAGGFVYGKAFSTVEQTEETTVIQLKPGFATVDMFLAVAGIPDGETMTYVLPFWYAPEQLSVTEISAGAFNKRYIQPTFAQLRQTNQLGRGEGTLALQDALKNWGALHLGLGFPDIFHILQNNFGVNPQGEVSAYDQVPPYPRTRSASATATLVRVDQVNLPDFVAKAGLPPKYAKTLAHYQAPYIAVLRLTGKGPGGWGLSESGIHCHFRQRLRAGSLSYTYPLRTGAAWAQPSRLTEVYVTCPERYYLHMSPPAAGLSINYPWFNSLIYEIAQLHPSQHLERVNNYLDYQGHPPQKLMPTLRASQMSRFCSKPGVRHVAYYHSRLGEDLRLTLIPRAYPWRMQLLQTMLNTQAAFWMAVLSSLVAWAIAFRVILFPWWRREGSDSFAKQMVISVLWPFGILTLCQLLLQLEWLGLGMLVAILVISVIRSRKQPVSYLIHPRLLTWALATALYLVFSVSWWWLARWAQTAVAG